VAADGTDGYPSRDDRIVAEFGDGFDVEGIAFRHGLTVAQVYAVVEREVGPAGQSPPGPYPPPGHYAPAPPASYYPPPPGQVHYGPPAYPMQPPPPGRYVPPAPYGPPVHGYQPSPGLPDDDAIVAEYGEGRDVELIARSHGITVERVYEVVQRNVASDPRRPGSPR
jgi:hypothetical protein